MYIHYDERFVFTLRYFDSNDNKTEGDIYTTKEIYDSVNIGDYYIANWKLDSSEPKKIERKATEDEKQKYGVD
jgi:hypothetical protein